MNKAKRMLMLDFPAFFCSPLVIFISAMSLTETLNSPQLLGTIVGSFGAGAIFANIIRDFRAQRNKEQYFCFLECLLFAGAIEKKKHILI